MGWAQLSKVHYIPPLTSAAQGNANPENQYIYISTPRNTPVNYSIEPIGESSTNFITGSVDLNNPSEEFLGFGNGQLFADSNTTATVFTDKGYVVRADDVIYVSVRMLGGNSAQAGALVSKGISALGTRFRAGMYTNENPGTNYLSFISVMASEDQTEISFSDLPAGISLKNYSGSFPVTATLDEGESFILAANSSESITNRDGLIGTLVTSDKPIAVNTGSANGSFHNGNGRDFGIDQIVDASKVGDEYIFVQGSGQNGWENVLLVADSNNTQIFINGNSTAVDTIDAGEYYLIEGDEYSSGNLYVETSNNVFAYQGIGGQGGEPNQGMFFVPPLSCETKGNLENIAFVDKIGNVDFPGGVTIVTKATATVTINNQALSNFITVGPTIVDGKTEYVTYKVTGLTGNISVQCDDELYCAYFNQNNAASSGSFYSGFPSPPEINIQATFETLGVCIGNDLVLKAINTENFDAYEWHYDDGSGFVGLGISTPEFTPTNPGSYKLVGVVSCSGLQLESPSVPVSICPDDNDNDGIIDNLDLDTDNDGIPNCDESYGNAVIDLQNENNPVIRIPGAVNELISGNISQSNSAGLTNTFTGNSDGSFTSIVHEGETSNLSYHISFNTPLNFRFSENTNYVHSSSDNEFFILKVLPLEKNITLIDPDNRLLVDTDYDGVFETGITQFSGVEIHFKINPNPTGTTPYYFVANAIDAITFEHHQNDLTSSSSFQGIMSIDCYNRDSDDDGISDSIDLDSDNDGILDHLEYFGNITIPIGTDNNQNGIDDAFEGLSGNLDFDNDGVPNYIDLDSDNDGIFDLEESGSGFTDGNLDGTIDIATNPVGENGLVDAGETSPDSGAINFNYSDTTGDGIFNFTNSDSDGDGCSDVIEAGFTDGNGDDFLGNSTPTVNMNGLVNNASDGYQIPNTDYLITSVIQIDVQPMDSGVCLGENIVIDISTNSIDNIYWEVSQDNGASWTTITDGTNYSNSNTNTLTISNAPLSFSNHLYRAVLEKNGNACGLISESAKLTVEPLPVVASSVTLKQCDNDTDGYSAFNLNEANAKISNNYLNETFTFYESLADAQNDINDIPDPTAFTNRTVNSDKIWARTTSSFGCHEYTELELIVSTTGIPSNFLRTFYSCDDNLDIDGNDTVNNNKRDGVSTFDFSGVEAEIRAIFPVGQQLDISFYKNEEDALAETDPIIDTSNYRNIGYPNSQFIYVRVDSQINNDCLGFGAHVLLNVEELPIANPVFINRQCDDNNDGVFDFDISQLETELLGGQSLADITVEYFDESGDPLPFPLPNPFTTHSQTITAVLTNISTNAPDGPCSDSIEIEFIVDKSPIVNPVFIPPVCDEDENINDGFFNFDTSTIQSEVLANQEEMQVRYFAEDGTELSSPLPNPFFTSTQLITVEISNPDNLSCIATMELQFQVNRIPEFSIQGDEILCLTEPASINIVEAIPTDSNEIYSYDWVDETGTIISNTSLAEISNPGIYMVTATTTDGNNCSYSDIIEITGSEIATITENDITIVDDSNNNTITINDSNLGIGDYEYSLNDQFSGYQDEPHFEQVPAGIHTIYIQDKNGCGIASIEVSVIGFPRFFTPNNDGYNDTWKVLGVSDNFYPNSIIYIFDRYGKLLYQVLPNSDGWNGIYNGALLPSTDYWFTAELIDENNNTRVRRGHFSLIRR